MDAYHTIIPAESSVLRRLQYRIVRKIDRTSIKADITHENVAHALCGPKFALSSEPISLTLTDLRIMIIGAIGNRRWIERITEWCLGYPSSQQAPGHSPYSALD